MASQLGPYGRLYEIDPRLRPTGKSGALATSLDEFARYFSQGEGQLWERQSLCKARVVYGSSAVRRARHRGDSRGGLLATPGARKTPRRSGRCGIGLKKGHGPGNLKRGPGGLVDIEFLVQMLQLKHAAALPSLAVPGTLAALTALCAAGVLERDDCSFFAESAIACCGRSNPGCG